MSKIVQIRNVPETLHRKLKVRAAATVIVVDASALLEFLLPTALGTRVEGVFSGTTPIVTCDAPLAKAPRHRARIEVIA